MNKEEFIKKYPATLQELLTSPCVYRQNFLTSMNLPFPGIHHMRDICEYAGYTYGALRTSLSRTIKAQKLNSFLDEHNIKRFRLTTIQQDVSSTLKADIGDATDFSIAIFSFSTEQERERRDARYLLQGYGFRLFAQNTYIRRRIKREVFENSLREYGLEHNVFLFDCMDPGTDEFKMRLFSQFEMDKAVTIINTFYADLMEFLTDELLPVEFSRRMLYLGPVYYNICYANEVPIPQNYFPDDYHIVALKTFLQSIPEKRWNDFATYYMNIENKGAAR